MEAESPKISCPKHPSESIQRVNMEVYAKNHFYCLECILQQNTDTSGPELKTIQDFLDNAARFYQSEKEVSRLTPEPSGKMPILQKANLDEFIKHISEEKQRVENIFDELTQDFVSVINKKKEEHLNVLDQQLFNYKYWHTFTERQIRKAYVTTREDISDLFPSREVLDQKFRQATDIMELTEFVRGIKEDMHEKKLKTDSSLNREENRKARVLDLLTQLDQIKDTLPQFDKTKFYNEAKIEKLLCTLLDKLLLLKDPVIDVLQTQILIKGLINSEDYKFVQECLPSDYQLCVPELLYSSKRDGDLPRTFHEKCDNKGPTLTFSKFTVNESSEEHVIGGFLDKDWNSNNAGIASDKAFIFSAALKVKCPLVNGMEPLAAFGSSAFGPKFGRADFFFLSPPLKGNLVSGSYQDNEIISALSKAPNAFQTLQPLANFNNMVTFNIPPPQGLPLLNRPIPPFPMPVPPVQNTQPSFLLNKFPSPEEIKSTLSQIAANLPFETSLSSGSMQMPKINPIIMPPSLNIQVKEVEVYRLRPL